MSVVQLKLPKWTLVHALCPLSVCISTQTFIQLASVELRLRINEFRPGPPNLRHAFGPHTTRSGGD
jgi:hypothetical protein